MGGYDIFCALCGARASKPWWDESRSDHHDYDSSVLTIRDTEWMGDVRIIGENPECASMNKVFISGSTTYEDYGFFDVTPGDDPNFPGPDQLKYTSDGKAIIRAFDWGTDHPLAIPFHAACYDPLLGKVIAHLRGATTADQIDNQILYETLKSFIDLKDNFCLVLNKIDYGPVRENQDQYWVTRRGQEAYVTIPTDIPPLSRYYESLPLIRDSSRRNTMSVHVPREAHDDFSRLPAEVLLLIMMELPMVSVNSLRAASASVALVDLGNGFWKQRVHRDMPFLYDMPHNDGEPASREIDWAQVYEYLLRRSEDTFEHKIYGLVNRRRIWRICEHIAQSYILRKAAKDENERRTRSPILEGALSTPMPRLIWPEPANPKSSTALLIEEVSDLQTRQITLSVFWTDNGDLSGIGVSHGSIQPVDASIPNELLGARNYFARRNDIRIQDNDWVVGLTLTTRSQLKSDKPGLLSRRITGLEFLFVQSDPVQLGEDIGDKRLMHVSQDCLLVGFMGQWSPAGVISKLALLHTPVVGHSQKAKELLRVQKGKLNARSAITEHLWKGQLPPPVVVMSKCEVGYWSHDFKMDLAPMEALMLGTNEEELSTVTAVSCDIQFGALEVHYKNQPPKLIGSRPLAMKSLRIDGRNGERIIAAYVIVEHITNHLRLVTNRNRQLVIGSFKNSPPNEVMYASEEGYRFSGLYCNWSKRTPDTRLETIGILSSPNSIAMVPQSLPTGYQDADGFHWEPEPPPNTWTEVGTLYGRNEVTGWGGRTVRTPSVAAVASWLDCSRPLEKIELVFSHASPKSWMSLVSLIMVYSDGTKGVVGPDHFDPFSDSEGENGTPRCWCSYRSSQPKAAPHYRHEEWVVGGQKLNSIRIWVDGFLAGFQFVTANGADSPRWGSCKGRATDTIYFRHELRSLRNQRSMGLKVFLDDNGDPVTYAGTIIVGLQALVEKQARRQSDTISQS